jgi:hypothetical protein
VTLDPSAIPFRTVASSLLCAAVFLRRFDPEAALSESRWEMGEANDTGAYLLITHEGAEKPAVVRLSQEDCAWKVGLAETFRGQPVR